METSAPQIPGSGPPKKGFWGAIANLFPKRPAPLEPPSPTAEVSPQSEKEEFSPRSTEPGELRQPAAGSDTSREPKAKH